MSNSLKIIFAGTPDFAAQHLKALLKTEHTVVAVYCPPDKPAGRGKKLTPCATKTLALEHHLTIEQPTNFKAVTDQKKLASYNADIMIVVAYGLLLPEIIIKTPRLGCINVHGSLLPKWRGAAPIQRALEAGDTSTGVTIMQMDKGLDTGAMILKAECKITRQETSRSLYEKLASLGPIALTDTLKLMTNTAYQADEHNQAQNDELATYAHKLEKTEAELNWHLSADQLERKVRAYIPWPVAQFSYTESEKKAHKIRIWQAHAEPNNTNEKPGYIISTDKTGILVATGQGALRLSKLQLPGKKPLPVKDILNGRVHWFTVGQSIKGCN
ncbi:MAG: methionyl-tRNA formyltransferase [Alteromonadales bacterium]|nr:methionyl-tRNA formyltransferase [Alteromonadales bacterium]